jgi:hypothetical protein
MELSMVNLLRELADRLNQAFPEHTCLYVHFDRKDQLLFLPGNALGAVGQPLEMYIPEPVGVDLDLDRGDAE